MIRHGSANFGNVKEWTSPSYSLSNLPERDLGKYIL